MTHPCWDSRNSENFPPSQISLTHLIWNESTVIFINVTFSIKLLLNPWHDEWHCITSIRTSHCKHTVHAKHDFALRSILSCTLLIDWGATFLHDGVFLCKTSMPAAEQRKQHFDNMFSRNHLRHYLFAQTQTDFSYCQPNTVTGWAFGTFIINKDALTHKVASLNSLNPYTRHAHKDEQSHGNCGWEKPHSLPPKHLSQTEWAIDGATGRNVRANSAQSMATWPKLFTSGLWEAPSGQAGVERVEIRVWGSMGKNCKQCAAFRRTVSTLRVQRLT